MMNDEKAVKVGDRVSTWNLGMREYEGCEFTPIMGTSQVEITKVPERKPERKPEIPTDPKTRGAVVTIEGDDLFIAVRFSGDEDMPYPYVFSDNPAGPGGDNLYCWGEIVARAAGRKIVVHEMVEIPKVPDKVITYPEWCTLPKNELMKYKWRDCEGDLWWYESSRDDFLPDGDRDEFDFYIDDFFPLTRDEKIG